MILRNFLLRFTPARKFSSQYDVAVIGGGPGGYIAAIKAGQKKLNTICIDKGRRIGGTGLNYGSIPSTALLCAIYHYQHAKNAFPHFGLTSKGVSLDMDQLLKRKNEIVEESVKNVKGLFEKFGVRHVQGVGSFLQRDKIEIVSKEGKKETITAKNVIIATGSEPKELPQLKTDEKVVLSSYKALSPTKIPKKLIVVGTGAIGTELGTAYYNLGSEVILVEKADRILPMCDSEISDYMLKHFTKKGFKIFVGHNIIESNIGENSAKVLLEDRKSGQRTEIEADFVMVSIGRRPYTKQLGVERIGLNVDDVGRILVNEELKTKVENVYAIGDVVRGFMREHRAIGEAMAVVDTIMGKPTQVNYDLAPYVLHSIPAIGFVGITEDELLYHSIEYKKGKFPMVANTKAHSTQNSEGFVKILTDPKSGKLLGAHIVSQIAEEVIGEIALTMIKGGTAKDLAKMSHAHPTMAEAIKEAAADAYDKSIHLRYKKPST